LTSKVSFDVIVGAIPDLVYAEVASEIATRRDLPLILNYRDPVGQRTVEGFTPTAVELQRRLIAEARGIVFASPLTMSRYQDAFDMRGKVVRFISCSFEDVPLDWVVENGEDPNEIRILHTGDLGPWRPVDTLVDAIGIWNNRQQVRAVLQCIGFVTNKARRHALRVLGAHNAVRFDRPLPYTLARREAQRADILLVVIGPRHADNVPAKFVEYLAFRKPLLVVGPRNGVVKELLAPLGIGVYCDISSPQSISAGIEYIVCHRSELVRAFSENWRQIDSYHARSVARQWITALDEVAFS